MALNFQQVILKLHQFWADQGCVIWEPHNVQVGAGTNNPATLLRVLGPEPWRVAYVEPSIRPDDGRYGENPNRMQRFYQYQVILKPDPGNPQELYLQSLEALGINPREHDIRFVEDNWESPALGAWGLGWEVWLDGQEITQYTYFQQAGGQELDPVSVEITYGLERITLALQDKEAVWNIDWMDGGLTYGDLLLQDEIEHCRYYFDVADVDALKQIYDTYEKEYQHALAGEALISAYDYVLKCSHLFNVLDTRGAIGVTERASYFRRMRGMTREVAKIYAEQRETMGHPLMRYADRWGGPPQPDLPEGVVWQNTPEDTANLLLEIGVEEMPAGDVDDMQQQMEDIAATLLDDLRLENDGVNVYVTPRRIVLLGHNVAPRQTDVERVEKGPPANRAFDEEGNPTKAAQGYARSRGLDVSELRVEEVDGGEYVMATVREEGQPTGAVLVEKLPEIIAGLRFGKSMRWNASNIAFSRPVRWIVALYGESIIPFEYAGVTSGNLTYGLRPFGSPQRAIADATEYFETMQKQGIILDIDERREDIRQQVYDLADGVMGVVPDDPALLDEVTNLVERPTALRGQFEKKYLELPRDVLVTVMRDKQRYFPLQDGDHNLMPYFITVRNGDDKHLDKVIHGNEQVLRARFSDADFFYREDTKRPLAEYLPRLATLTFQEHLGSMLDKNQRVESLIADMGQYFEMPPEQITIAEKAAHIAKADLATNMVVEMTSLQGIMGREYALLEGQPPEVAQAVFEHWLPRGADDILPESDAGTLLGITDRLDSLVGLFAAGLAPKSNADPYGLRRAALGIIQLMVADEIEADLTEAIDLVAAAQPIEVSEQDQAAVLEFITGRLRVWLQERDLPVDVINAVLAEQASTPYKALTGAEQLTAWTQRDDWEQTLDGFARCVRITRNEAERYEINPDLFQQEEENQLYAAYQEALGKLDENGNVDNFLSAFQPMLPAITAYFGTGKGDGVLVNAEDESIRQNRLGLLQAISAMQDGRADLSELSGF